ncbi:MAG: HAD family phosphatase [bacterium]|nr:HAD family phosphatase [bacterium]
MVYCPRAVIFDMDGLLVDSEPVWNAAERAVITARGRVHDVARQVGMVGLRLDEYWSKMAAIYELEEQVTTLIEDVVGRMRAAVGEQAQPRPGARELLAFLEAHRVPIALASSSPNVIIDTVVESKGWLNHFTIRVSGDEVAHGKPAPDVYLEAARRLGADPAHTLALEDSVNGARAAVAAGMTCFAVPDLSHATRAAFDGVTPHVYDSLHDVLAALQDCAFA